MAGLDIRNSGWVSESFEAQLGGSVCPGNPGLEVWNGPEFRTYSPPRSRVGLARAIPCTSALCSIMWTACM